MINNVYHMFKFQLYISKFIYQTDINNEKKNGV